MKNAAYAWIPVWSAVMLVICVAVTFGPVLTYDFVRWDDDINVTANTMLRDEWSWSLVGKFFDPQVALRFKPLHWLVFRVTTGAAGLNPAAWHAVGLVFHACASVAVFAVFRVVLRWIHKGPGEARGDVFAWLGAAIWALHPLRVEPVAWVTASTYPMTGMFLAGSFWAYVKAYESETRGRWLAAAWIQAVAAYATYPTSITYVAWLIAADFFLLKVAPARCLRLSEGAVRTWWLKQGLFAMPAVVAVAFTLWTRLFAPGFWRAAPSVDSLGWDERLLGAAGTLAAFVAKVVWPVDLTPNQGSISGPVWFTGWILIGAAVTLGAVVVAAWFWQRGRRTFVWVGAGFTGLAVPCLGLTEYPTWPVDRYSYALDMVLVGAATVGLMRIAAINRLRRPVLMAMAAVVLIAGGASLRLIPIWRNSETLFAHMEAHPEFGRNVVQQAHVYKLWGAHLGAQGRVDEAAGQFTKANGVYVAAMKRALRDADYEQAVHLSRLMEVNLGLPLAVRRERGAWLIKLGNLREALSDLRQVVHEQPDDTRARELLIQAGG